MLSTDSGLNKHLRRKLCPSLQKKKIQFIHMTMQYL